MAPVLPHLKSVNHSTRVLAVVRTQLRSKQDLDMKIVCEDGKMVVVPHHYLTIFSSYLRSLLAINFMDNSWSLSLPDFSKASVLELIKLLQMEVMDKSNGWDGEVVNLSSVLGINALHFDPSYLRESTTVTSYNSQKKKNEVNYIFKNNKCSLCGEIFSGFSSKKMHLALHHKESKKELDTEVEQTLTENREESKSKPTDDGVSKAIDSCADDESKTTQLFFQKDTTKDDDTKDETKLSVRPGYKCSLCRKTWKSPNHNFYTNFRLLVGSHLITHFRREYGEFYTEYFGENVCNICTKSKVLNAKQLKNKHLYHKHGVLKESIDRIIDTILGVNFLSNGKPFNMESEAIARNNLDITEKVCDEKKKIMIEAEDMDGLEEDKETKMI